jgi:carbon monoxide dehydrogenase subunit G
MKMTGEERIEVPRVRVWEALNDPEVLRRCIPGCLSLEKEAADRLRAVVELKVGPIGARFTSTVTLTDIDPQRSYTLTVAGQGGTVGSAKSDIRVRLADEANGTLLSYELEATIGGRLAQLGGGLIDATAKQFATRFFKRFGELAGDPRAAVPAAQTPEGPQASANSAPAFTTASRGPATSSSMSVAWLLAVVIAALVGFLIGRGQGNGGSDWMGIAIGLLLLVVAAAAYEAGRRAATPQIVLDARLLQRLLEADKS